MNLTKPVFGLNVDPIDAILARDDDAVLAIVVGVEGPSYRPIGATMAVFADRHRVGTLSSGCIENDITLHALKALEKGRPATVRYGRGSPFMDIRLPCGGGLEILLVPRPDRRALHELAERRRQRIPCSLRVTREEGTVSVADVDATGSDGLEFHVRFTPEIRFLVFGKGPEAGIFAALVQSAGYPNILLSPDDETLEHGAAAGCAIRRLTMKAIPAELAVDPWTAIVLFFHDHDWEPPILAYALSSPAFYIGAQGSEMARNARNQELEALGFDLAALRRLHGPIGLVRSARDARTLAISVLAEVLSTAAPAGARDHRPHS
ncbi:XdhC family protein [Tabrizicola sp.]|uniref:XdhC family protein n=1 Tax=Tabrizicola sp. TaxID=2005166 RepID=UPI0035B34955